MYFEIKAMGEKRSPNTHQMHAAGKYSERITNEECTVNDNESE